MKSIYCILSVCTILIFGCKSSKLSFTPEMKNNQCEFHFGYNNVNGLLSLMIWEKDTRSLLWEIDLNYYQGSILKYGEIPSGYSTFNNAPERSAMQKFPADLLPPRTIPTEKDIWVCIDYQYDSFLSACSSSKYFSFRLNTDGTLTNIGEQAPPALDQLPVAPNQNSKPNNSSSPPDH